MPPTIREEWESLLAHIQQEGSNARRVFRRQRGDAKLLQHMFFCGAMSTLNILCKAIGDGPESFRQCVEATTDEIESYFAKLGYPRDENRPAL